MKNARKEIYKKRKMSQLQKSFSSQDEMNKEYVETWNKKMIILTCPNCQTVLRVVPNDDVE
jgi:hypothetical protein